MGQLSPRSTPSQQHARSRTASAFAVLAGALLASHAIQAQPLTTPATQVNSSLSKSEAPPHWRKAMSRASLPKAGCFKATYPGSTWEEVPCIPPPPNGTPLIPAGRGGGTAKVGPALVGTDQGVDSTAVLAPGKTISWAEGSFPSVVGVTSADSSVFSLQLNSNYFSYSNPSSSPCAGGNASCQGWAQFAYSSY